MSREQCTASCLKTSQTLKDWINFLLGQSSCLRARRLRALSFIAFFVPDGIWYRPQGLCIQFIRYQAANWSVCHYTTFVRAFQGQRKRSSIERWNYYLQWEMITTKKPKLYRLSPPHHYSVILIVRPSIGFDHSLKTLTITLQST